MKKTSKRLLAFVMALVLLACFQVNAFAAVSVSGKTVKGDNTHSVVFSVVTNKKCTLNFTQTQGKISYQNLSLGTSYAKTYGDFFIYVQDNSGKEAAKVYNCTLTKSTTITLSANKTYTITICPVAKDRTFYHLKSAGKLKWIAAWENSFNWVTQPTWSATANNAVSVRLIKSVNA